MARLHLLYVSAVLIAIACLAHGQQGPQDYIVWFQTNQQVRVANLPTLTADSTYSSEVLAAALEIVLHDKALCCRKQSALEDAMLLEPRSLQELRAKLQGKHYLSDGLPVVVDADYVPLSSIQPGLIIASLENQHAFLIKWNSQVYVLYGVDFNETHYASGQRQYAILKLWLLDPRFSDDRREVGLERGDWGKIQGILMLKVVRQ